jgi:formylglycine-generating enzyme required for sulfatase activity
MRQARLSTIMLAAIVVAGPLVSACDECRTSQDCATGQACIDGECTSPGSLDTDADTDADGDSDADTDGDADTDQPMDLEWIEIPGGEFTMGKGESGTDSYSPAHTVTVAAFEMTRTEVTVHQYLGCVGGTGCTEPDVTGRPRPNWGVTGRDDHPVNYVTWEQARDFCTWAGGRLPSEAEWEYAARGAGQDIDYPWGNEAVSCDFAVIKDPEDWWGCGEGQSVRVCDIPAGNTAQGLCDMSGNVVEWVQDHWHGDYDGAPDDGSAWVEAQDYARVMRGGCYQNGAADSILTTYGRSSWSQTGLEPDLGFRCARDAR